MLVSSHVAVEAQWTFLANFSKADDSRYRLLVEAIEVYAIYMLDRTGIVTS